MWSQPLVEKRRAHNDQNCIQQKDSFSCGLYVAENIRAVLAADPIPQTLELDELRLRYQQELLTSAQLISDLTFPAATANLVVPDTATPSSENVGSPILQRKLKWRQELITDCTGQHSVVLKRIDKLRASQTENRKLHIELMDADIRRLLSNVNTDRANKHLQTFVKFPALPLPKLRDLEVDKTLADYETQLKAAQQTLEYE